MVPSQHLAGAKVNLFLCTIGAPSPLHLLQYGLQDSHLGSEPFRAQGLEQLGAKSLPHGGHGLPHWDKACRTSRMIGAIGIWSYFVAG